MSPLIIQAILLALMIALLARQWRKRKLGKQARQQGQDFLAANNEKEGVITLDSGLQYEILASGDGEKHPDPKSKVTVHYHGTFIDGTVFDSSVERNKPITFPLNRVIKGWQLGVTQMVEGDKWRLYVPSELAYGRFGGGKIPPHCVLIFEVELIKIVS